MKEATAKKLEALIKDETVLWGLVNKLGHKGDEAYMELSLPRTAKVNEKVTVVIMDREADTEANHGSLVRLMRRTVPFVLIRVDGDVVYASRKLAQEKLKLEMLQDIADGKTFQGTIISLVPYGAFVEVNGITGLLRNNNATTDHSEVGEHFKRGDIIEVKCKDMTRDGRVNWEAIQKVSRKEPVDLPFEEDTVVSGTVTSITAFKNSSGVGVFVRVAPSVDALCAMPEFEIFEGMEVAVKITRIEQDVQNPNIIPKVRGRIIRTL